MAKALYRKYRPKKLADVIGQEQVTGILANSLKQGKISHAYLFIGPRGTGKTSVARIFAHEVNGFKYELEDNYVDIVEIDGASNRGIDNIRDLCEKATIAPTSGKYKIYIIDEVHMLTKEAFNALLKTLEEPPKHVIFIMATTDAYKVPATIVSRSQIFRFELASPDVMFNYLKGIAKKENIKISDDALSIIVRRGGGSFRDSLSLLDQISTLSDSDITSEMVLAAMGITGDEKIVNLLTTYVSRDITKTTAVYKELLTSGVKAEVLAENLINYIIENPQPEYLKLLPRLADVKTPYAEARLLVALTADMLQTPTVVQPVPEVKPTPAPTFNWDDLVKRIQQKNEAIYLHLKRASYDFDGAILNIYPANKMGDTILKSKNNLNVLRSEASVKITIHSYNEKPEGAKNDAVLSRLSDIMGGEVRNDGGENPF